MISTSSSLLRLPPDFRRIVSRNDTKSGVYRLLRRSKLNTVCEEARCPNLTECFSNKTATFMILGDRCTRRCHFCSVQTGRGLKPDPDEPNRLRNAVLELGLKHVVITSVDRDDLPDLGSGHFAACIRSLQEITGLTIELLTPDFKNREEHVQTVLDAGPDIWGHNTETVPRLYQKLRPQSKFETTLALLERVAQTKVILKSGIMVGLGETDDEISETLKLIRGIGVQMLTIGQYLRPSLKHWPVARYVAPESYARWEREARELGFLSCYAGPFVRSSYHAGDHLHGRC